MPSITYFPSPTRISPASVWQPCPPWQNWRPPACSLTTQYQQTCFRLLFNRGDYIAIKISTWCRYNAKFIHNLHLLPSATHCSLRRGSQSSCHRFWPFCFLLKEALQENVALWHWLLLRSRGEVRLGIALCALFNLWWWHVTNTFQHVKEKVKQVLP